MVILLITRPLYDSTTHYLYFWNQKVIEVAIKKRHKVLDLKVKKANKKTLESYIKSRNPNILLFNGHGTSDSITGQNHETLIKVGDNEAILKNKIVYALSCKTGQVLGSKSVLIGAIAFIGYKEDFNFWLNSSFMSRPLEDPRAKLFFEPSNQIGISILKGHTVKESYLRAKNLFLKNIQKLVTSNSPDQFVIPDLIWDMVHLGYHGSDSAYVD